jgi:hypothetical protein
MINRRPIKSIILYNLGWDRIVVNSDGFIFVINSLPFISLENNAWKITNIPIYIHTIIQCNYNVTMLYNIIL